MVPTAHVLNTWSSSLVVCWRTLEVLADGTQLEEIGHWKQVLGVILPLVPLFSTCSCNHDGLLTTAQKHGRKWPWTDSSRTVKQNTSWVFWSGSVGRLVRVTQKQSTWTQFLKLISFRKAILLTLKCLTNNWLSLFQINLLELLFRHEKVKCIYQASLIHKNNRKAPLNYFQTASKKVKGKKRFQEF